MKQYNWFFLIVIIQILECCNNKAMFLFLQPRCNESKNIREERLFVYFSCLEEHEKYVNYNIILFKTPQQKVL